MKIAITADLHLTSRNQNQDRFGALENLLADLRSLDVKNLFIAGDLFDASQFNYSEFEQLCQLEENRQISITVIPGNHDASIANTQIVAENLEIITEPRVDSYGSRLILFLPYRHGRSMGEEIEPFASQLVDEDWLLLGHGDWSGGLRTPNPHEPGIYMPLTRKDIELYKPSRVLLGHIHIPMDLPPLHYPGSPCGLDITESGKRRYLIYDTDSNHIESRLLKTPVLYFDESFLILPVSDEADYLQKQINDRIDQWDLEPDEKDKAVIRIRVRGYSSNRALLRDVLDEAFEGYDFYKGQKPNLEEVSISDDVERQDIAEKVWKDIEDLNLKQDLDDPAPEDILIEALNIIYRS